MENCFYGPCDDCPYFEAIGNCPEKVYDPETVEMLQRLAGAVQKRYDKDAGFLMAQARKMNKQSRRMLRELREIEKEQED